MRLERLHVDRLPGLSGSFDLQPGPGVNLLLGPNATGKSSVARAVQGLFWPASYGARGHELTARFEGGLEAARTGGPAVTWRLAGEGTPVPAVPGDHLADCYRLGAPDLLVRKAGAADTSLAREIRKRMTGGVDLDAVAGELPEVNKGSATKLGNLLTEAGRKALAVNREHAELDRRRAGLSEFAGRLAAADSAGREVAVLEKARELARARAEAATAAVACDAFEAAVARARDEDTGYFDSWSETVASRKAKIRDLVERQEETTRSRAALALPTDVDPDDLLTRLETRVRACGEAAQEAARTAEVLAAADRAFAEARSQLGDPDDLPDDDSLPGDTEFADLVGRHRAALAQGARHEALDRLAAEFAPDRLPSRTWPALLLAAGVLAVAAPAVPDLLQENLTRAALALGFALVAIGGVLLAKAQRQQALADRSAELAQADEPAPDPSGPWNLGRSLDEGGWLRDLDLLREAQRRRNDFRAAEAAAALAASELARKLASCGEIVAACGMAPPATADIAVEQMADLRRRMEKSRQLGQDLAGLLTDQEDAKRERDEAHKRLGDLLARLGLPAGTTDPARVRELVEQRPAWLAADEEHRRARASVAALASAAEVAELAEVGVAEIEGRLEEALERAGGAGQLRDEMATLRERIAAAQKGHDRAESLAEEDRRRDDLADWRDRARARAVTSALLDELRAAHDDLVTPPQLQRARDLFAGFTRRRYALKVAVAAGIPVFRTQDRESDRWLELDELSGGTRAQLLLAVRLAFLDQAEAGPALPLFLDESLTTADDERLAAIVGGLGLMARDTGRQVFYLTSNPADVGAWTAALAAAGLAAPTVLDLAEQRNLAAAATAAELAPRRDFSLPDPARHDAASYGRAVRARRFDPGEPWQAADTIHLCGGDVTLIHGLRVRGLGRAGVLATALADDQGLPAAGRGDLALEVEVLKAFNAAWRQGRPPTVTTDDINASGAVSMTMREPVLELVKKMGGRGPLIMAALRAREVKGFYTDKMDLLENHLAEAGCLDHREPLDADGLVHAVQKNVRTSPGEVRTLVLRLLSAVRPASAPSTRPSGSDPTG